VQDITLNNMMKNILATVLAQRFQCLDSIIQKGKGKETSVSNSCFIADGSNITIEPQLILHRLKIY
jgi:hypothetical protein